MTNEHLLAQGRVPLEPIRRHADRYLKEFDSFYDGIEALAGLTGISQEHLTAMFIARRGRSMQFGHADLLMCAMGAVDAWHCDPELAALWDAVDLSRMPCVRQGCRVIVAAGGDGYCSRECRQATTPKRSGRVPSAHCMAGHERATYSVVYRGKTVCMECRRIGDRARKRRQRH